MRMKKISAILISVLFVFVMAACGSQNNEDESAANETHTGKVLVVYYSATGNTE